MVDDVAFLVTSSNSFPLPISIALNLSGLSVSQPELIQVPISEEENDSNDAAISQLVSWGPGGEEAKRSGVQELEAIGLIFKPDTLSLLFIPIHLPFPEG